MALLCLCALLPGFAPAPESLSECVEKLIEAHKLADARVGIAIYSVKEGAMLFEREGDDLSLPASNMKLFTTATALLKLSPDHEFKTTFGYRGAIGDGGTLEGDLVVVGGGDPNISGRFHDGDPTAVFKGWADDLKTGGVRVVTGDILLDDSIFDAVETHPAWKEYDLKEWWTAPVGGLSLNDNCVDITVTGAKNSGARPVIKISPETAHVRIVNKAETVAAKKKWGISFGRDKEGNIVVDGTIGPSKSTSFSAAVTRPTLFFGAVLKETLAKKGIEVRGKVVVAPRPEEMTTIDVHRSELIPTITIANRNSQNFYAESILKYLGAKFGKGGSFEEGAAVVRDVIGDIGIEGFKIEDGSGLSKNNRASPRQICALLRYMREYEHGEVFIDSLAVGGATEGTLRKRMKGKELAGRVRAKSGHLDGTTALSGYLTTIGGDTMIFSIVINDIDSSRWRGDAFQEDLLKVLVAR